MANRWSRCLNAVLIFVCVVLPPRGPVAAMIGDLVADHVIGESSFTDSLSLPIGASSFALPRGVAIDRSVTPNRVYVSDSMYHRVLGWNNADALTNGAPADLVIGQPDFSSFFCNRNAFGFGFSTSPSLSTLCAPQGLAVDGAGNLYVADTQNCRVLIYDDPFGTDQVADVVLGQADGKCGVAADRLYDPQGVAVDAAGNVYVADTLNCRVLEFDTPLTGDQLADRVYGQPDFTHGICDAPVGRLYFPQSVTVDGSGRLYAGSDDRVYAFTNPLSASPGTAGIVYDNTVGTSSCNGGGEGASTTCGPIAVAADAAGHLYVGDAGNSRILEFDNPLTVGQAAREFGQPGFTGNVTLFQDACNTGGPSDSSLCLRHAFLVVGVEGSYVEGAALDLDSNGNLWVADTLNNRVVRYDNPLGSDNAADLTLGHAAMDDIRQPLVALTQPAVALGGSQPLILDRGGSRLLIQGYDRPLGIIGQPDFNSTGCNTGGLSAASLCNPTAVATDGQGNVWVADTGNNRVLEYYPPLYSVDVSKQTIMTKKNADRVFGQPDFTSNACAAGASGLCEPRGVAVDSQRNLYISDAGNNRVVWHQNPLADVVADQVFGQPDFGTSLCNSGGVSAASLCNPRGLVADGNGNLYVADQDNHRVLRYNVFNAGGAAVQVFGQGGSMTTGACGAGASGLCGPSAASVDGGGNLLIADTGNNRVLEYDTPLTNTAASRVFGQSDFTGVECNASGVSAQSLCKPTGVAADTAGNLLYLADAGNERVLSYAAPYCIGDFQLTPVTRRVRGLKSGPTFTSLTVAKGAGPGTDLLKLSGGMILLERDGGIGVGDAVPGYPVVTLATAGGTVFQGEIAEITNLYATPNGGVWQSDLRGLVDSGIDLFKITERFIIPFNPNSPQRDTFTYRGEAVGLDLSAFTASQATLRMQFQSTCFTTQLQCRTVGTGRRCIPALR
jgi:sugar lactone lactonase YvrE